MNNKIVIVATALSSITAFAAEAGVDKAEKPGLLASLITLLLPVVVILIAVKLLFRGTQKKSTMAMDLSLAHMERSEKQAERMVELLEQINNKLDKRSEQIPPPVPSVPER